MASEPGPHRERRFGDRRYGGERGNGALRTSSGAALAGPVRLNLLITGTYAWGATVAAPVFGAAAAWPPRASAALAWICLLAGVLLSQRWPRAGRGLTMIGFLGSCVVSWVLLEDALNIDQVEPVRAASGAVGWALFALGWGSVRHPRAVPEHDPNVISARPLEPRRRVPPVVLLVFLLSVVGALLPWLWAWSVTRAEHALLAHVLALGAAMWMVNLGAKVAVVFAEPAAPVSARQRLVGSLWPLLLMVLVGVLSGLYLGVGGRG